MANNQLKTMDYCKLYFGKDLHELTFEDVEKFFLEEKEESDKIEFKSFYDDAEKNFDKKEKGVLRSISGFLNSEGGIIIWGAPIGEKVEGKKEKIFKGKLSPVSQLLEKDSFIRKVTNLITPAPRPIRFQPVQRGGEYIYVIEVEQSPYPPHQFQNYYYMRLDGQTVHAPHHYVEALFKKVKYPNLEGYVKIVSAIGTGQSYIVNFQLSFLNWSALQNEENLTYRFIVSNGHFINESGEGRNEVYSKEMDEHHFVIAKDVFYYGEPVTEEECVEFMPYKLIENQYRTNIILTFGGRFSPLKASFYTLDFNKINSPNPNDMIIEAKQNILFIDYQTEIGSTKESILEDFI